jgi:LysM repeat protein
VWKKRLNRILSLILVLAFALGIAGFGVQPARANSCTLFHTVQRGESLSKIALMYDTNWKTLAEINDLKNPNLIYSGQELCVSTTAPVIPDTGSDDRSIPKLEILKVRQGEEVSIRAEHFPSHTLVNILMGKIGTRGEQGIIVATVSTNRNGAIENTFLIPATLREENRISVRLEALKTGYYAYNWFSNRNYEKAGGDQVVPKLDPGDALRRTRQLRFEETLDIYQGNGGFFMPRSNYTGWVQLDRYRPNESVAQQGLNFVADLLEVHVLDLDQKSIEQVYGINYVYFNLNRWTRRAYDSGDLKIYFHDPNVKAWEPCEIQLLVKTKNQPHGRLTCVIEDFGLHALAEARK